MIFPHPKPTPVPKKARKGPKKVNRKRKVSEFARCYHSRERVRWVKFQPCAVCGEPARDNAPSENAHTVTGGMGRKADYETIVPLCHGCHRQLHTIGIESFERMRRVNLSKLAAWIQYKWKQYLKDEEVYVVCRL